MPIHTFMAPEQSANETKRQAALDACGIGEAPDPEFDAIAGAAAKAFAVPIALVSIVARRRQWFKARVGLELNSTPRSISFCAHAINGDSGFTVPDALANERFAGNPLVIAGPRIRFHAGAPLPASGHKLGTFCLPDSLAHLSATRKRRHLPALPPARSNASKPRHYNPEVEDSTPSRSAVVRRRSANVGLSSNPHKSGLSACGH